VYRSKSLWLDGVQCGHLDLGMGGARSVNRPSSLRRVYQPDLIRWHMMILLGDSIRTEIDYIFLLLKILLIRRFSCGCVSQHYIPLHLFTYVEVITESLQ